MNINGYDPFKKGFDMLAADIQEHEARCVTPSRCEPFSTKLSAEGVNRLGDTIADLRMQVKEMVDTLRMAREALDNNEFALCAGMIDAAMKVGADKTANDRVEGRDAASSRRVPSHDGLCGVIDTE